ncbi:hypothetical protein ACFLZN_01230 [Nanoarchaeota archaeon]
MKKAVQSPLTWVFIMIAGALILIFFVTLAYRYQEMAQQKLSIEIESSIDSVISDVLQSSGSSVPIPMPRAGIAFHCSSTCDCRLRIGSIPQGSPFAEKIYFAHGYLKDVDITLWALSWNVPFRATNFLYVTNPMIKYYIVTDSSTHSQSLKDEISEIMPSNMSIEFIDISSVGSIPRPNFHDVKFLFLDSGKSSLDNSFEKDVMYSVELKGNNIQFLFKDSGSTFFQETGQEIPLITDDVTGILGAMFSADPNMFLCNMQKAYTRLKYVSQVFTERTKKLDGYEDRCYYTGPAGMKQFEDIAAAAEALLANPTDSTAVASIDMLYESLEKLNREQVIDGCPELY